MSVTLDAAKILAKYDKDMKDVLHLLKKTALGMSADIEKQKKRD